MSKAVTAEAHKISSTVAKHASKKDLIETAVFKATQSTKEVPPKDKHMRTILEETHILGSGDFTFNEIFKRPVAEKEMILFKTLYIVHKMIRDGSPRCVQDIQHHSAMLKSLHNQYKGVHTAYGSINAIYLGFLIGKIDFHKKHPEVSGDCDVQKYRERGGKKNTPKEAFELCNSILELQKLVLAVEQKILQTGSLNQCKVCPIVPLLYESFNLYNFAVSLLNTLCNYEEADPLIDLFNKQFPVIQKFYFQCTTIPYITAIVTKIPELSSIPVFELKGERRKLTEAPPPEPPKKEKKPKKPKPEPLPPVKPLPVDMLTTSVVFQTPQNLFQNYQPAPNPFATTPNPFAYQAPPPPVDTLGAENREALKRRIRELEALIRETQLKISDMDGQNKELRQLLNQADTSMVGVQELMQKRLDEQREAYMRANGILKSELDALVKQNEGEKLKLIQEQINFAKEGLDGRRIDPNHTGPERSRDELEEAAAQELKLAGRVISEVGNMLKTVTPVGQPAQRQAAQSVVDATSAITQATNLLVAAASEQQTERIKLLGLGMAKERDPMWTDGLLQASRAVAAAVKALAEAAALAAAGKIDDQALIAAARAVASATAQLVTASRAGSGEDSEALDRAADAITRATRGLVEAARLIGSAEEMAQMERSQLDSAAVEEEIKMSADILRIQKQIEKAERKLTEMRNNQDGGNNSSAAPSDQTANPFLTKW